MEVKNLSFNYGDNIILDNLNFKVKKAEILGIVGESGAGKSTLLRLLGNLISIQEGQIINSEEVGVIFQNFNLFPHLNVIDNLTLSLRVNKKLSLDKINIMADKLLDDFKIKNKANSFIDQLSGGEKQRVAIARALMLDPKILLIDEATSNLDPKRRDEFMEVLDDLRNKGMTIVIVSHDHQILDDYCNRIIYLLNGVIEKVEEISE